MTEQERREFDRRKADAEAQLHKIYYGSAPKSTAQGLKMPGFLAPTKSATSPKQNEAAVKKPPASPPPVTRPAPSKTNGMNLLNLLNFKGIQMDHDRLIILALCMLLASEEADELLLLALLYIML